MSRLYCKITSEKAAKGQGGQYYVRAEFLVMRGGTPEAIAEVRLDYDSGVYLLRHKNLESKTPGLVLQHGEIGEKQKGESA